MIKIKAGGLWRIAHVGKDTEIDKIIRSTDTMAPHNGNKGVLIVEDDMILAMVIERMLNQLGYRVMDKVKKGEEAVQAALRQQPDIILMDIRLDGKMDGIEAVKQIHASTDIPVIYITGNNDPHSRERANQTAHTEFLVKPVNQPTLQRALQEVCNTNTIHSH